MKKLILCLVLTFIFTLFPSCKKECEYLEKFSQLRENVLVCETSTYFLTCYAEVKENPYLEDGEISTLENCLIFKLTFKDASNTFENCKIKFCVDKSEYQGNFEFKPLTSFLYCTVKTQTLPKENLYVNVILDDKSEGVELVSVRKSSTVSYCKAIESLKSQDKSVNDYLNSDYEIRIRLIYSGNYNYWYIGFISKGNRVSYLLDGETAEMIAKKNGL